MRRGFTILLVLGLPATLAAQRVVDGQRLISTALPAAVLEVASGFTYAGTQTFELYGVAQAEQHFFVDLDGSRIRRLLWIQYEGYLPSNTQTYGYRDDTVSHSGQTWHRRISAVRVPETEPRPDSDGARARAFLRAKGWSVGGDILLERLVWLLDSPPRNELMVIYLEALGELHLTAADLAEGGAARDRWPVVSEAFHQRAVGAFRVSPP